MRIFRVLFNPFIHESGSVTLSIHRTREGALKAMTKHQEETKQRHEEHVKYMKDHDLYDSELYEHPWDADKEWSVNEIELED